MSTLCIIPRPSRPSIAYGMQKQRAGEFYHMIYRKLLHILAAMDHSHILIHSYREKVGPAFSSKTYPAKSLVHGCDTNDATPNSAIFHSTR